MLSIPTDKEYFAIGLKSSRCYKISFTLAKKTNGKRLWM